MELCSLYFQVIITNSVLGSEVYWWFVGGKGWGVFQQLFKCLALSFPKLFLNNWEFKELFNDYIRLGFGGLPIVSSFEPSRNRCPASPTQTWFSIYADDRWLKKALIPRCTSFFTSLLYQGSSLSPFLISWFYRFSFLNPHTCLLRHVWAWAASSGPKVP